MANYVALLRGINIGGNQKVPMAELKKAFEKLGYKNVKTLLNTGNVAFESSDSVKKVTDALQKHLEKIFGFPIFTQVWDKKDLTKLVQTDPFKKIKVTKDIRLYVSFVAGKANGNIKIPYTSPDKSFKILNADHNIVLSILDLKFSKTPDAMNIVEKEFGKTTTTRNWNTVVKISNL